MRRVVLPVVDFPGVVYFLEASSPAETRVVARSIETPPEWHWSRSYRGNFGVVAFSPMRVGVDIEVIDPTVTSDAVLTPTELRAEGSGEALCSWWSAKEALAKALGDARHYDPRSLATPARWQSGFQGRWIARNLAVPSRYVGWLIWESDPAGARL